MKDANVVLLRVAVAIAGYVGLLLMITTIPPPSPIADRLSQPQWIQVSEVLQKRF